MLEIRTAGRNRWAVVGHILQQVHILARKKLLALKIQKQQENDMDA